MLCTVRRFPPIYGMPWLMAHECEFRMMGRLKYKYAQHNINHSSAKLNSPKDQHWAAQWTALASQTWLGCQKLSTGKCLPAVPSDMSKSNHTLNTMNLMKLTIWMLLWQGGGRSGPGEAGPTRKRRRRRISWGVSWGVSWTIRSQLWWQ